MKLFVVGKWKYPDPEAKTEESKAFYKKFREGKEFPDITDWDIQGIFFSEEIAIKACLTEDYFIQLPIELDERFIQNYMNWNGCYHPKKGETYKWLMMEE